MFNMFDYFIADIIDKYTVAMRMLTGDDSWAVAGLIKKEVIY